MNYVRFNVPHSILLMNHHRDTNRVMKRIMEMWGLRVTVVETIEDAMAHLGAVEFAVFIARIHMSDGNSRDRLGEIRSCTPRKFMAVSLSGDIDDASVARFRAAGFEHCLPMPFSGEQLEGILRAAVGEAAPESAANG